MSIELKQAAQQAVDAFDAFGDADDVAALLTLARKIRALRTAIQQAMFATPEPVGRVRIDSGEVHIIPRVRDAEASSLTDGQSVYSTPQPPHATQPAEVTDHVIRKTYSDVMTALREENRHVIGGAVAIEIDMPVRFARAILALRPVQSTFCEYCGGNDEEPVDHCMDCTRPVQVPMTDEQREHFNAGYEAAQRDALVCHLPPNGWHCTRIAGHDGPCAAIPSDDESLVKGGMDRLREAHHGNPFAARCYTMSESYLSGHRLIVGFEKLEDAQAAHEWVARSGRGDSTNPAPGVPDDVARDAERYRWLRSIEHCNEAWCLIGSGNANSNLDAAIDAAMLTTTQAQKGGE